MLRARFGGKRLNRVTGQGVLFRVISAALHVLMLNVVAPDRHLQHFRMLLNHANVVPVSAHCTHAMLLQCRRSRAIGRQAFSRRANVHLRPADQDILLQLPQTSGSNNRRRATISRSRTVHKLEQPLGAST